MAISKRIDEKDGQKRPQISAFPLTTYNLKGGTQIRTGDQSFAGSCLTAWPCHQIIIRKSIIEEFGVWVKAT